MNGERYDTVKTATGWYSLNPDHGLRTDYLPGQATVRASGPGAGWAMPLTSVALGCAGRAVSQPVRLLDDDATISAPQRLADGWADAADRVWYAHGSTVDRPCFWSWYVNGPRGLEQGFTVPERPACSEPGSSACDMLVVRIAVGGELTPELDALGSLIRLQTGAGETVATYGDASAVDGSGHPLAVQLDADQEGIVLRVDLREAVFPIEIDPLVSTYETQLIPTPSLSSMDYGAAVAISGDVAVVGQPGAIDPTNTYFMFGAAYVFRYVNGAWTQEAMWRPDGAASTSGRRFGAAVAVGDDEVLVGSPGDPTKGYEAGAVYRYVYESGAWVSDGKLYSATAQNYQGFGATISLQGSRMAVGSDTSPGYGHCDAFVFDKSGAAWTQSAMLNYPTSAGNEGLCSVALDGSTVVVGSPALSYDSWPEAGAAFIFKRSSNVWSFSKQLLATPPKSNDRFGAAVAVASGLVVVGAPGGGLFYAYRASGTSWPLEKKVGAGGGGFGASMALAGQTLLVGSETTKQVKAYWTSDAQWTERGTLARTSEDFGLAVAMSADRAIIGEGAYLYRIQRQQGDQCATSEECATGFCADGVCCNSPCNAPGGKDCLVCSKASGATQDGVCGPAKAGTICRAATGVCDLAETCNGTAQLCPEDRMALAGEVCRDAVAECDLPETCTGTSKNCPTDKRRSDGVPCRPKVSECDVEDTCDGATSACPDVVAPAGTWCRPSAAECDDPEACDGVGSWCPPDAPKRAGTPCRGLAGECDLPESCDGVGFDCPVDQLQPAGSSCRIPTSGCDLEEYCDGQSASCPADAIAADGERCPGGTCAGGVCYTEGDPGGGSDSGCGCTLVRSRSEMLAWLAPALALLFARRRRKRSCDNPID